jgi:polyisoprenoid-binding protein YceI
MPPSHFEEIDSMSRQPAPSARSGRSPIIYVVALVVIAALVAGGYGVWYLFLRAAGPAAVADATLPPVPGATAGETAIPIGSGGVDGTWNVDTSIGTFTDVKDTSGNFVGYRVQEQLAGIGANTAVGRTPKVTGSLTIAGTKVTAVDITADMTALQSDDSQRDNQLRNGGIQFSQFPTATFKLTAPIDLGSIPADGKEISATASGQLTLHGVTKDVQIALKAKLSGSTIVVSGSLPIAFADYSIEKPNSFKVLSIDDNGTMELQLFFTHT